jgi:hypothetical protein
MGISSKTRKNLWAKSGNRCSICKTELFSGQKNEDEFNIGEECHIISSKPNGPRYKPNLDDYDTYDNLILLCRNHHKEIDELTDSYTEELLRYMKLNHENWVKTTLTDSINNAKKEKPRFLTRITSGNELLNIISDSHGYRTDYDEVVNEEDAKYIGGVLQELTDYGDISSMVEVYDKVQMGLHLNELLKDLEQKGYFLFGEKNIEKIKFGNGDIKDWAIATIVIKKKDNEEIIKINLSEENT